MQGFGQWWKDNGTQLGMYFNSAILYLDAFQESIKELFHFAATWENLLALQNCSNKKVLMLMESEILVRN